MSDDEKGGAFVVKDRRRFDSEGNERSPDKGEAKGVFSPQPKPEMVLKPSTQGNDKKMETTVNLAPSDHEENAEGAMTFSSFIMSLATQTLMQLGEIKPPPGVQIEVDKVAAMQTIDILGMLQNKTKGNLDAEESHLIEGILHNLRLSFVKASK